LLDRRIERVHVDMDDLALGHAVTISSCEQKENCEWPLPRNPICSTNGGCPA
jgi:hypothetical protein